MERLENVATPATADTVAVPDSTPPPGLTPIATVMLAVELVTVLPNVSSTATPTPPGLLSATPAVALFGWTVKATLLAAAGTMVCCCGVGLSRLLGLERLTNGPPARVSL